MEQTKSTWIYSGRDKVFENELATLKKWKTSQRNKTLITAFQNFLFSRKSGKLRVAKLSSQLRRISLRLNKDFDQATKEDILSVVSGINQEDAYGEATKSDYRRCIKQFYMWYKDDDDRIYSKNELEKRQVEKLYKYLEKDLKISYKRAEIDPKTVLTDEDIDIVLEKGCRTIKEKALVKFLHESGVRAGELLNMKIGDLDFKEDHVLVTVDGKTGRRTFPITNSVPYLVQYLGVHPYRGNQAAFLWIGESRRYKDKPLFHVGCQKLIYRVFAAAEMGHKRHNLHWFRHSRATLLAPLLTEAMLCKYLGWIIGSKQPRAYLHIDEKQLETVFLQMKGIKADQEKTSRLPQKCVCGCVNDTGARYCYKCGKPLNVKVILDDEKDYNKEMDKSVELLMQIAKNPELLRKFEEFRKSKQ